MLPLVDKWELHILVVLSFTLQVFLLLFGGIRRRNASAAARIFLWLVYLLSDSTATYTLGLMASRKSDVQQLVVFWAPFLVLHLGGQDTVTAYALEDNELWLRHLFSLAVQGFGAAYILYKYKAGLGRLLTPASILVFVVGVVKYGERIWALKCASMSSMKGPFIVSDEVIPELRVWTMEPYGGGGSFTEYRRITGTAHSVLEFSKRLFVTPNIASEWRLPRDYLIRGVGPFGKEYSYIVGDTYEGPWVELKRIYRTVDLELSLMYDLLYTKSAVIHTWYGYIIRASSFSAIISAFVLFIMSGPSSYSSRGDVVVTYILLVGACVLEIASIVRVVGSTWTCAYLRRDWGGTVGSNIVLSLRWHLRVRLGVWFSSLCHCNRASSSSSSDLDLWPANCIGQLNLITTATSRPSADIRWKIAKLIRQGDRWINAHHSTFIKAPHAVVEAVYTEVKRRAELNRSKATDLDDNIREGRWTTRSYKKLESLSDGFHERGLIGFIISCHIATDVIVHCCDQNDKSENAGDLPEIAMVLSNYMMYLLRVHKDMFSTVTTDVTEIWDKKKFDETFTEVLPQLIHCTKMSRRVEIEQEQERGDRPQDILLVLAGAVTSGKFFPPRWDEIHVSVFLQGSNLAALLLESAEINSLREEFQFLVDLWVDTLLYVTDGLTANFHAKQLSCGGEFVTVISVLMANVGLLKEQNSIRRDTQCIGEETLPDYNNMC